MSSLLVAACTSTTAPVTSSDETRVLRDRVLELQRKAAIAEVELARLREQVARLEVARLDDPSFVERRSEPVSQPVAIDPEPFNQEPFNQEPVNREPVRRSTSERIDSGSGTNAPPTNVPPTDGVGNPGDVESADLEPAAPIPFRAPPPQVVTEVEEYTPPVSAPSSESSGATTAASRLPVTEDAQALYDQGYTLFHQSLYLDAEAVFQRFLQRHGATDLGDNAQFWIGESRAARGDYQGALAAYREAIERYPTGNKLPDAMLKVGESLEAIGDLEGARITYDELVEQYPFSAAATTALEHLSDS